MSSRRLLRVRCALALLLLAPVLAVVLLACGSSADERRAVILAATTSTQDSGLLDVLVPAFEADTGWSVRTIALGSGQSIALGLRGEADVVLAHSPDAERALIAAGVARSVSKCDLEPERLRGEVRLLLDDRAYRERARDLQQEIRDMPAPDDFVEVLEHLARTREPVTRPP